MASDQEQRTEEPTAKRLDEAFQRGQFPRSPDVPTAFVLVAGVMVIGFLVPEASVRFAEYTRGHFSNLDQYLYGSGSLASQINLALLEGLLAVLPFVLGCGLAALLGAGLQTGFRLTPEAFGFKWENLDLGKAGQRLFSGDTIAQIPYELLKLALAGAALWSATRAAIASPIFHFPTETHHLPYLLHRGIVRYLGTVSAVLAALAGLHYLYQRWKTLRDLRMSRQEIKDEQKQAEGDPLVKSRMRRMARQLLTRQMMRQVPLADVVVTNPTHYAVALRYERGRDAAPVVLAKGMNLVARRIRELARAHDVPTVENRPLARLLYKSGVVGESIPVGLYQAVAEVLAFVYRTHRYYFHRLKARRAAAPGA